MPNDLPTDSKYLGFNRQTKEREVKNMWILTVKRGNKVIMESRFNLFHQAWNTQARLAEEFPEYTTKLEPVD